MEVKLPSLSGNYDRPTSRRIDRLTGKFHFQQFVYTITVAYSEGAGGFKMTLDPTFSPQF